MEFSEISPKMGGGCPTQNECVGSLPIPTTPKNLNFVATTHKKRQQNREF